MRDSAQARRVGDRRWKHADEESGLAGEVEVGWLAGWRGKLVGWLAGWLAGQVGWLADWLAVASRDERGSGLGASMHERVHVMVRGQECESGLLERAVGEHDGEVGTLRTVLGQCRSGRDAQRVAASCSQRRATVATTESQP